ncbi:hypothetical protein [Vibrio genomosp. F6]|uniref:Uncharacterized protein n=1 Tax=Vibrio genomosp. F6 str. FF-238 TaxID=1191298 RepID=A0A1E5D4H9_9VIBR|nr:hypothetical protein [Vibrio genomosp. F6]OEE78476.1 hypothetical protein A130_13440 [Vibrio genomosp. F6 str. FF-238]
MTSKEIEQYQLITKIDNLGVTGNSGNNSVVFSGAESDYTITKTDANRYVIVDNQAGRDGKVTVKDIEILKFSNSEQEL